MKKYKNPIPTHNDYCIVCGIPFSELHEVYFSADSNKAKYYGMQVRLCGHHHRTGKHAPHNNIYADMLLKHVFKQNFKHWYPEIEFNGIFRQNYDFSQIELDECRYQLPKVVYDAIMNQLKLDSPIYGYYRKERKDIE